MEVKHVVGYVLIAVIVAFVVDLLQGPALNVRILESRYVIAAIAHTADEEMPEHVYTYGVMKGSLQETLVYHEDGESFVVQMSSLCDCIGSVIKGEEMAILAFESEYPGHLEVALDGEWVRTMTFEEYIEATSRLMRRIEHYRERHHDELMELLAQSTSEKT